MDWTRKTFSPPSDAHTTVVRLVTVNNLSVDQEQIRRLLQLVSDYRSMYSLYYVNGRGLIKDGAMLGSDELDTLVKDRYHLKPQLANPDGGEYSHLELAFLIAIHIHCRSDIAAKTIGSIATKRNRDKIGLKLKTVKMA